MRNALSVAIAALLVTSLLPLASVAAAPGSGSTVASPSEASTAVAQQTAPDGTTERLGLEGSATSAYADPSPDFGTALAATDDELRREWTFHELEYNWDEIPDSEREERIEAYNDQVLDRLDELEAREKAAVRAMTAGDAPVSRVLNTLARNDHEAEILRSNLDRLSTYAPNSRDFMSMTRTTKGAIETHEGPVRDEAFHTFSSGSQSEFDTPVLVETTDSGVLVSSVTDGSYLREVNRYDNRDLSRPSQLEGMSDGNDRLRELYPWAQSPEADAANSHDQFLSRHQFTFEMYHTQGLLRVHLDSGTTDVFRETQELELARLPIETAGSWTGDAATVELNVTPRDGPIQFNVTDTETGTPLDATVLVDGEPVTRTGDDGAAWVVRPLAESEIAVEVDGETISVEPGS
ncbi:hypothetical protein Halru_2586 [Halovivax ruber XH-70]|uniref:Uncharacterized protein n=1 Tax=Halovivax ruber (strain DSM 18193 / JCM 13892 / XH-70) TaxID=797302 RepID=L0IGQ5_HALRX|nr:hypothetical protein [Halovivax ruber]AGB17167.1 hypothetical protein Halru_2586 [Halovivax ruber XH-70]